MKYIRIVFVVFFLIAPKLLCQSIINESRSYGKTEFEAIQKAKIKAISNTINSYGIKKSDLPDTLIYKIGTDPDYFIISEKIIRKRYSEILEKYEVLITVEVSKHKILELKKFQNLPKSIEE